MKPRIFLSAAITAAIVIAVICGLVLWKVPIVQIASLKNAKGIDIEDVFKAENEARTSLAQTIATLAQILGGFAVLIGVYFAWQNITSIKEGQVTDRFYKAIEQLGAIDDNGKPKFELRLGGIHALERIARDSEKDHWPIMEVLTAYVREHAKWKGDDFSTDLATDIQAILTIIRRRKWAYENRNDGQKLDLHGADLHGATLNLAHLEGAELESAHLERGHLGGVHLEDAFLLNAHLEGATLLGAHLEGATLADAQLESAILVYAHLEGAQLGGAHLEHADLIDVHLEGAELIGAHLEGARLERAHLDGANLIDAHLEGAELQGAHLENARLEGAHLEGADLSETYLAGGTVAFTQGLTQAQIDSAIGDASTKLPQGIVMPESWKQRPPR